MRATVEANVAVSVYDARLPAAANGRARERPDAAPVPDPRYLQCPLDGVTLIARWGQPRVHSTRSATKETL
jgi:hypothetical protein